MDYRYDISTYSANSSEENPLVNVVVEIPKGTIHKYEIDPEKGDKLTIVRDLHKSLLRNYSYPFSYGFIPSTLAPDNDQLDAIILAKEPIDPLSVVECRIAGVVRTVDHGEQDDKILLVPNYLPPQKLNLSKIIKFLKSYKYPDNDSTTVGEILDEKAALQLIEENRVRCHK